MAIKPWLRSLLGIVAGVSALVQLSGCTYGLLYTNVHRPLSTNMNSTVVQGDSTTSENQGVSLPLGRINLSARWSNQAIGEAAQQAGITNIHYLDLHTVSVLLGIWGYSEVTVVGEKVRGDDLVAKNLPPVQSLSPNTPAF
jgi:hypothetical protein